MSLYKVGIGHNVPLVDLVTVTPQPRNGEVKYMERRQSDDGPVDVGPYSAPTWGIFKNAAQYQVTLGQFGLLVAETCDVTWYTQDDLFNWKRYNGVAALPEPGVDGSHTQYFLRGFVIFIRRLKELED